MQLQRLDLNQQSPGYEPGKRPSLCSAIGCSSLQTRTSWRTFWICSRPAYRLHCLFSRSCVVANYPTATPSLSSWMGPIGYGIWLHACHTKHSSPELHWWIGWFQKSRSGSTLPAGCFSFPYHNQVQAVFRWLIYAGFATKCVPEPLSVLRHHISRRLAMWTL